MTSLHYTARHNTTQHYTTRNKGKHFCSHFVSCLMLLNKNLNAWVIAMKNLRQSSEPTLCSHNQNQFHARWGWCLARAHSLQLLLPQTSAVVMMMMMMTMTWVELVDPLLVALRMPRAALMSLAFQVENVYLRTNPWKNKSERETRDNRQLAICSL